MMVVLKFDGGSIGLCFYVVDFDSPTWRLVEIALATTLAAKNSEVVVVGECAHMAAAEMQLRVT